MANTGYPPLYQINTRIWLNEVSHTLGHPDPATLDAISDMELDRLAELEFDWVWLLSVWQMGEASRALSRSRDGLPEQARSIRGEPRRTTACSHVPVRSS